MPKTNQLNFPEARSLDRFIVAIGASAGGLEAINEFFDNMPENSGLTFIVIQHLSPDYKSLLVELVGKHTHMKVFEATNDMMLQRNCVYIIPNKKLMTIRGHKLKLVDKIKDKTPNTAIDTFLVSLARDKKEKAIAIILSGTGTDGTKGIEAIKETGGMVLVQEPETAKFDGMPNSAITSGNADFILPPSRMHEELNNFIYPNVASFLETESLDDALLEELFKLVSESSGQDFNLYKTPTITRRIGRRMAAVGIAVFDDYVKFLKENPQEVKLLAKDFLIGVTKFFRDKPAFDILAKDILPEIIRKKQDGDLLKVWICACSTGEEAYSVAILVNDCINKSGKNLEVKFFATDVDDASIEIASKNSYPLSIVKEVPADLLKKYFIKERKAYSIIPSIRKQIVFARHNVIKSPPFIKNDLVTCRNMLIYMNSLLQQKVIATLHYSLNKGGYLFLGSSENATSIKEGVTELSNRWKFYQKTGTINYGLHQTYTAVTPSLKLPAEKKITPKSSESLKSLDDEFRELMIEEFGSVAIFIDKNYAIKETIGNFHQYLTLPEKKLDLNVLNMVNREVALLLNTTIRKAWKENKKMTLNRIRVKRDEEDMFLQIVVKPPSPRSPHGLTQLMFCEAKIDGGTKDITNIPITEIEHDHEYLMELEAELNETRTNLQMAIEEMETTNEELQSSNEELLSANEELQSGNEELQSLNEELHTLNTEHQVKINELTELNDDLDNYFKSTDIGQIFIDSSLRIRKFNPAAVKMVNLIPNDVGRPINHISSNIEYDSLINDIHAVLSNEQVLEKEVKLKNGSNNLMRIMPFVRKDKQLDGVVITFIDISLITELNSIISGVFNASSSVILAFKVLRNNAFKIIDFICTAYNSTALDLVKKTGDDLNLHPSIKSFADLIGNISMEQFIKVVESGKPLQTELQTADQLWFQVTAVKMDDGFVINLTNVTERKSSEQKLRKNYHELITAREGLKTLNNQLEDRVFERTQKLTESEERFNLVSKATNDTIWDWNLVTNTMWRSDNFTIMFGYECNEETNSVEFWFSKIHPDDRKRVQEGVFHAINNNNKQWSAEYRFLKADNNYAYILDRGSILEDEFRTPYRLVGSIVDITRQKESENRLIELLQTIKKQKDEFYSIFDNAPALITIRRGPELAYEFVNKAYQKFDGQDNLIGKPSAEVATLFDNAEFLKTENDVFETGVTYVGKTYHVTRKEGKSSTQVDHWFDIIIAPVYDDTGNIDGLALFGFEVTDLIRARKSAEELMYKKDEFMSIASHELKTPVTSLKGSLQILERLTQKMDLKDPLVTFILKAVKQTDKLTVLLNDLLDVTKIQEGKMLLNYSEFDARGMIQESIDEVRAQNHKHELILNCNEKNIIIKADRARLEQVINNFLTNAIKYSPDAGKVEITCSFSENSFRVEVRDFGIGIPKNKKDFLFDRFYRVQESSTHFAGLGLGLYISAEIVKRHHGEIGVESVLGEGSTFWFSIPVNGSK
ncbi:chemotaxis protein CheB [Taibaiella lutea]|uniref:chemotaxis protein CheB n=1 Tax=Taibaiella lutea TaxID=2608001 RepID=UPI001C1246DA|nr:chemotaxis protein CheB [Taibaiella lutea]